MDGVAKTAAHARDWKFITSRREVDLAMMLKKISSPYVGNVIGRSMRIEERRSITREMSNLGQYDSALMWLFF
jgi:hypothetical protein